MGVRAEILDDGYFVVIGEGSQIIWESGPDGNWPQVEVGIADVDDTGIVHAYIQDSSFNKIWWTISEGGTFNGGPCIFDYFMPAGSVLKVGQYMCASGSLILGMGEDSDLAPNACIHMYFNTFGNLVIFETEDESAPILRQSDTAGFGADTLFVRESDVRKDS